MEGKMDFSIGQWVTPPRSWHTLVTTCLPGEPSEVETNNSSSRNRFWKPMTSYEHILKSYITDFDRLEEKGEQM